MGIGDYSYEQIPYSVLEMGWICSSISIPAGLVLGRFVRSYVLKTPVSTFPKWPKRHVRGNVQGIALLAFLAIGAILYWPVVRVFASWIPEVTDFFSVKLLELPIMPEPSRLVEGAEYRIGIINAFGLSCICAFYLISILLDIMGIRYFGALIVPVILLLSQTVQHLDTLILTPWIDQIHWEYYLLSIPAWALIEIGVFLAMNSRTVKKHSQRSSEASQ